MSNEKVTSDSRVLDEHLEMTRVKRDGSQWTHLLMGGVAWGGGGYLIASQGWLSGGIMLILGTAFVALGVWGTVWRWRADMRNAYLMGVHEGYHFTVEIRPEKD